MVDLHDFVYRERMSVSEVRISIQPIEKQRNSKQNKTKERDSESLVQFRFVPQQAYFSIVRSIEMLNRAKQKKRQALLQNFAVLCRQMALFYFSLVELLDVPCFCCPSFVFKCQTFYVLSIQVGPIATLHGSCSKPR